MPGAQPVSSAWDFLAQPCLSQAPIPVYSATTFSAPLPSHALGPLGCWELVGEDLGLVFTVIVEVGSATSRALAPLGLD